MRPVPAALNSPGDQSPAYRSEGEISDSEGGEEQLEEDATAGDETKQHLGSGETAVLDPALG